MLNIIEKAREFLKNIYLCFIDYIKAFDCVDHNKLGNSERDGNTYLLRNLYAGQEATELDMEQQTGSKLGKEYIKAVYCHPACLAYVQRTSCKIPGWMSHRLKSRLPAEISTTYQHTRLMNSQNNMLLFPQQHTKFNQNPEHHQR